MGLLNHVNSPYKRYDKFKIILILNSLALLFHLNHRKLILLNALLSSVFMFSYIVFLSVHTAAHELGPINGILEKIHFKVSAIIKNGALF